MSDPPPRQPPARRAVRAVFALLIVLVALFVVRVGLPLALAAWHYTNTPDFETLVRERPFRGPLPADVRRVEQELARGGNWSVGEVDPFALDEHDPTHERQVLVQRLVIRHGDQTLLHLEQEVAEATLRGGGDRMGLALRTLHCRTHPHMRAEVRTWISDPAELVGPGSRSRGLLHFEALLFSGAGADELVVALGPSNTASTHGPPYPTFRWWRAWPLGWIHPPGTAPQEGLFYRVEQPIWLTWSRNGNNRQGILMGGAVTQVNSEQYSNQIELTTEAPGVTYSSKHALTYTFQDRTW